jgi:hypothetical protein
MNDISIAEARKRFPGAMEDPNAEHFGEDPAGHDALYVNDDGALVMGNYLDDMYDVWVDDHWEEYTPEEEEEET